MASTTWPEQFESLLPTLLREWKVNGEVEVKRTLSGRSGATILEVDLASARHHGRAVLKLSDDRRWPGELDERARHERAWAGAPSFASVHLPTLLEVLEHSGQTALLLSIAGDALEYTLPLLSLDAEQRQAVVQQVAKDVLWSWNEGHRVTPTGVHPRQALSEWLGYRLRPHDGGRLHEFLEGERGLPSAVPAFSYNGVWYPNPLAYCLRDELWSADHTFRMVRGHVHGDLHGHNVLARIIRPGDYHYYLIDLALYSDDAFLFYDHAYLELSHLLHDRPHASHDHWVRLMEALNAPGEPDSVTDAASTPDDTGQLALVRVCRQEIGHWISARYPARVADLHGQALLARVAAGLNFVNKSLPPRQREFALLYAAAALRKYLQLVRIRWTDGISGPSITFGAAVGRPPRDEWRTVWERCHHFKSEAAYTLIAGPGMRDSPGADLGVLGRIPWLMVVDFDRDLKQGVLLDAVREPLQQQRAIRVKPGPLNYAEATRWFMASEYVGDVTRADVERWRRETIPHLRTEVHALRKAVLPRRLIVLAFLQGLAPVHLRWLWECFDEVFGDDVEWVVVWDDADGQAPREAAGLHIMRASTQEVLAGLWHALDDTPSRTQVRLPRRSATAGERTSVLVSAEDAANLAEDLEVIHAGLAERAATGQRVGLDFWRGHEITWTELGMSADVPRAILERLKATVHTQLATSINSVLSLTHAPGAGGTTLAKRLGWDLKELYPTALLHRLSPRTADRVQWLFETSGLPVLLIADAARVSPALQTRLAAELQGRNVRVTLLSVIRLLRPEGQFALPEPMESHTEGEAFYQRYASAALPEREPLLRQLMNSTEMVEYRSPFFFGLYAFEEEFVHVPEYVRARLTNLSDDARRFLRFVALVTRFSPAELPDSVMKAILGLSQDRPLRLDHVLDEGPRRLVLHRGGQLRIVHPRIAEEVLRTLLAPETGEWNTGLGDLCLDFIGALAAPGLRDAEVTSELLTELFITRGPWDAQGLVRLHFSELITSITDVGTQNLILSRLVELWSHEPHFWNHLGRHYNYKMDTPYQKAEECLQYAIEESDGRDDTHYHSLGMVYRFEAERILTNLLKSRARATAAEALTAVREMIEQAQDSFARARALAPESEYAYISDIQLLTKSITQFVRLAREPAQKVLNGTGPVSAWCREKLDRAESLLNGVRTLNFRGTDSWYVGRCASEIRACYGDYEAVIHGLKSLLERGDVARPSVRRLIVNAQVAANGYRWEEMPEEALYDVHVLLTENLNDDALTDFDVRMWFRAFRRLEAEYDTLEAIRRFRALTLRQIDSGEAYYYLYILHWLQWYRRDVRDRDKVLEYMAEARTRARPLTRTRSFEWLGREHLWCPVVHESELGGWDDRIRFHKNPAPLGTALGVIDRIDSPQAGEILVWPEDDPDGRASLAGTLKVFFVPGTKFVAPRDEGELVRFNLGFSAEGPRGWRLERITNDTGTVAQLSLGAHR